MKRSHIIHHHNFQFFPAIRFQPPWGVLTLDCAGIFYNFSFLFAERDLAFVMNATSESANKAFELMKQSLQYVIYKHKNQRVKYQILIHGQDSSAREISFANDCSNIKALSEIVDQLTRNPEVILPALHKDLEKVSEAFEKHTVNRPNTEKVGIQRRIVCLY